MEFVNLDEDEDIVKISPTTITKVEEGTTVVTGTIVDGEDSYPTDTVDTINTIKTTELTDSEEDEHLCVKDNCNKVCQDESGYFLIANLFQELQNDYQKAMARSNLGIANDYSLIWGNIGGNLSDQTDLYKFVNESLAARINELIEEVNLKLSQWAADINVQLNSKANILSPNLLGTPTTTLPDINDNSKRIASTEWVTAKVKLLAGEDTTCYAVTSPKEMYYGDSAINLTVNWEYSKNITSQSINGIVLDNSVRTYTFNGVTDSKIITIKYTYGTITATKIIIFQSKIPIYYGTSSVISNLNKTSSTKLTVDSGTTNYIYIYYPGTSDIDLEVNGIYGGFKLIGTSSINEIDYYVFKSVNYGLGKTIINIITDSDSQQIEDNLNILLQKIDNLQTSIANLSYIKLENA